LFAGAAGALALSPVQADRAVTPAHHDLTGLRLPDRPIAVAPSVHDGPPAVVVRPGDTLWAIAARSLPTGATAPQIAEACAQWHAANRDVIGDDPDLIFPTQHLTPPPGKDPT
jgi:nucleoid-associated protein YgaU